MNFTTSILNETTTANGAVSHKSTLNACLDLFSMGVSSTYKEPLLKAAMDEDIVTATKVVFHLRDCRGGQGNKDIARTYHKLVSESLINDDDFFFNYIQLLPYLPEIGSWKDVFDLYGLNDSLDTHILVLSAQSIYESPLAAKWFPRQSQLHKDVSSYLGLGIGEVRRHLATYSKTVEQQMCKREWSEINYKSVPSLANKKYSKAFKRNDENRYEKHLASVLNGKSTMNSSVLYPHEITSMMFKTVITNNNTANALWKSLPNFMDQAVNILPVIDVSGSMRATVYGNYTAMDIAIGLGIYFAERNTGDYKDLWCNFSKTPTFYKLSGDTLFEKIRSLNFNNWNESTNIQAVFDKILQHSTADSVPKAVIIVSDMEFDCTSYNKTNFQQIKAKYAEAGLEMPTLIFWRVNVSLTQQPVTEHESGSILINGYSPSIMKLITSLDLDELKSITPLTLMNKALEKYDYIDTIFQKD